MNSNKFLLALQFCFFEFLMTAFLIGFSSFLLNIFSGYFNADTFHAFFRNTLGVFTARFFLLQAFLEVLIIFIIIRFGWWNKLWLVLSGVFISVLVWGAGSMMIDFNAGFLLLKIAMFKFGCHLFLGTLFSWWLLYKWAGYKT